VADSYPRTEKDYPGFRFYMDVEKLANYKDNMTALFSIQDDQSKDMFLQVMLPGMEGATYYKAKSLKTKTSGRYYHDSSLPLFTIHTNAEARTKPFVAVFEPYKGKDGYTVSRIALEKTPDPGSFTVLTVHNTNNTYQEIYQSIDQAKKYNSKNGSIQGFLGIATVQIVQPVKTVQLLSLYLGSGTEITNNGYSLKSPTPNGSANLILSGKTLQLSCNQPTEVGVPSTSGKKATLQIGDKISDLKTVRKGNQIVFEVPAVNNGIISFK